MPKPLKQHRLLIIPDYDHLELTYAATDRFSRIFWDRASPRKHDRHGLLGDWARQGEFVCCFALQNILNTNGAASHTMQPDQDFGTLCVSSANSLIEYSLKFD